MNPGLHHLAGVIGPAIAPQSSGTYRDSTREHALRSAVQVGCMHVCGNLQSICHFGMHL